MHTSLCVCVCEHSHGNYSVHQKTTKVILNITRKCGFALAAVVFLLKCTDNVTSLSGKKPEKEPPAKKHLLERVTLFFIFILFFYLRYSASWDIKQQIFTSTSSQAEVR